MSKAINNAIEALEYAVSIDHHNSCAVMLSTKGVCNCGIEKYKEALTLLRAEQGAAAPIKIERYGLERGAGYNSGDSMEVEDEGPFVLYEAHIQEIENIRREHILDKEDLVKEITQRNAAQVKFLIAEKEQRKAYADLQAALDAANARVKELEEGFLNLVGQVDQANVGFGLYPKTSSMTEVMEKSQKLLGLAAEQKEGV